jgi:membrane protein YqaA with SNARE-associated domain
MSVVFMNSGAPARLSVHQPLMPHWLTSLGALGLFSVAVIDSSVIPVSLPGSTDLLLLWLVASHGNPWLLALSAIAGSVVGGYTTWHIGRKGGEDALRRYVPPRILGRIVVWVERHPVLSVFLPAVLPPPIPLLPFALAAGALGVTRQRFILVYGSARTLRYSLVAWVGVTYGRHVVRLWSGTLQKWSTPLLCIFAVLIAGGVCFGIWKIRNLKKPKPHGILRCMSKQPMPIERNESFGQKSLHNKHRNGRSTHRDCGDCNHDSAEWRDGSSLHQLLACSSNQDYQ